MCNLSLPFQWSRQKCKGIKIAENCTQASSVLGKHLKKTHQKLSGCCCECAHSGLTDPGEDSSFNQVIARKQNANGFFKIKF